MAMLLPPSTSCNTHASLKNDSIQLNGLLRHLLQFFIKMGKLRHFVDMPLTLK